jgi:hypothetical protein
MITMDIIEMLYFRFVGIFGDRFCAKHTPIVIEIWHEEWFQGLQGLDPTCFREALAHCRQNLEWSPSIAQFISICDRSLNIPDARECMELAIRLDFSHEIVKKLHDRIGNWDMKTSSAEKLLELFKKYHHEEMIQFRHKRYLSAQSFKQIEGNTSHGSEISGDNMGGHGVRKIEGYLF